MTGKIANAVNHSELADAKTEIRGEISNATESETDDVSNGVPFYVASLERYSPNGCTVNRFGRMVTLSVCFGVTSEIGAGAAVFGFPAGYYPQGSVFCVLACADGTAVPMYSGNYNGATAMICQIGVPTGVARAVVTYIMTEPSNS